MKTIAEQFIGKRITNIIITGYTEVTIIFDDLSELKFEANSVWDRCGDFDYDTLYISGYEDDKLIVDLETYGYKE